MPHQFRQVHLADHGLLNDSNNCCMNCVILCCHRMGLGSFLVDPGQVVHRGEPDYPILLLNKVLDALPPTGSAAFSLQMFISSWNLRAQMHGLNRPFFGQYEDILICDTIIGAMMPYLRQMDPPVFTKYAAKFFCINCHVPYRNIEEGQFRMFQCIPILSLPLSGQSVSPGQLLTTFLDTTFDAACPLCNNLCNGAVYEATCGRFTLLALNRRDGYRDAQGNLIPKVMTRLSVLGSNNRGDQLCGELVSVICHSGDPAGGHWVSYHKCDNDTWWCNDDSRPVYQIHHHPFNGSRSDETVDFLVYKNF